MVLLWPAGLKELSSTILALHILKASPIPPNSHIWDSGQGLERAWKEENRLLKCTQGHLRGMERLEENIGNGLSILPSDPGFVVFGPRSAGGELDIGLQEKDPLVSAYGVKKLATAVRKGSAVDFLVQLSLLLSSTQCDLKQIAQDK
ncbi:Serum Paraoxonase/Arylesterase 1 [Manis pentadactyla]|nr:Serum Paraoxonase/Arylesterase 1 [Manis pentadactyla]